VAGGVASVTELYRPLDEAEVGRKHWLTVLTSGMGFFTDALCYCSQEQTLTGRDVGALLQLASLRGCSSQEETSLGEDSLRFYPKG
jgi:hypothetical protein